METESRGWSPYLAGALTGGVIIASAWIAGNYFGASTSFVRVTAFIEQLFSAERVSTMDYFRWFGPRVDWQVMMVLGILIGSFISSMTDGSFKVKAVPDMWESRFGPSTVKRSVFAFVGGVVLMFGARLAGGCPSGYGLGALVQLAVSGLIVVVCFFAGGIIFANIIYRGGEKQ
ncbi:putative inner membrane protein [bacterium BMS3Abin10]|nr:putative inner membrane protein [bacterium BMS3Abin10]GBE38281.1 putative inner membrane protein [bacterium BMS3Bbin08]HDH51352.1 YeeE/YedE family protein [Nitrospirota bacterium]